MACPLSFCHCPLISLPSPPFRMSWESRVLQPTLLSAVPIVWLLMQIGFWRRHDKGWVPLPALLPSAQHQTSPPRGWQCSACPGEAAFDLGAAWSPCRAFQALQTSPLSLGLLQPPWHRLHLRTVPQKCSCPHCSQHRDTDSQHPGTLLCPATGCPAVQVLLICQEHAAHGAHATCGGPSGQCSAATKM